jgi:hypothetical protein
LGKSFGTLPPFLGLFARDLRCFTFAGKRGGFGNQRENAGNLFLASKSLDGTNGTDGTDGTDASGVTFTLVIGMWIAGQTVMGMAKTNKIAGLIKKANGSDRPAFRSGQAKPPMLYLLELRSHHAHAQSPVPKRRLVVTIDPQHGPHSVAKPVKIFHSWEPWRLFIPASRLLKPDNSGLRLAQIEAFLRFELLALNLE